MSQRRHTVGQNSQELGRKHWATCSSVRSFARSAHSFACTVHSFACSTLLASLARSAALIRSLARFLTHSRARGKENDSMSQKSKRPGFAILSHSALFLVLLCFLVSEHVSPAAGVRIEPSGKTKYKKESANLYLECLLDPGEEMEGQCSRFMCFM